MPKINRKSHMNRRTQSIHRLVLENDDRRLRIIELTSACERAQIDNFNLKWQRDNLLARNAVLEYRVELLNRLLDDAIIEHDPDTQSNSDL